MLIKSSDQFQAGLPTHVMNAISFDQLDQELEQFARAD
jgi:hypothetical protein